MSVCGRESLPAATWPLVSPDIIEKCSEIIERAIAMRKNPLQLSRLLGFKFIC